MTAEARQAAFARIAAIVAAAQPLERPAYAEHARGSDRRNKVRRAAERPAPGPLDAVANEGENPSLPHPPAGQSPPAGGAAAPAPAAGGVAAESKSSQTGGMGGKPGGGQGARSAQRDRDARKVAGSAEREADPHPAAQARPPSPLQGEGRKAAPPGEDGAALDRRLAFFPLTDLSNAERFRERNRGKFIWCGAIGWYWWDGRRWSREGAEERIKIAEHMTVRGIQDEADAIAGTPLDKEMGTKGKGAGERTIMLSDMLRGWGRASEANSRITPIGTNAAVYLAVQPGDLDADPFAVNVLNGTLRIVRPLSPGEGEREDGDGYVRFTPHDPADLITRLAPVDYDPNAPRVRFDQFIAEVQPQHATRRSLQAWKGYALTGDMTEQKLAVLWGKGKNGKSVFEEVTAFVAGDYCATTPIETFLAEGRGRNAGQATPELAVLPGVRMLRTSEPKKGASLDEGLIKLVTGGEVIMARHLNRGYFNFYPSFKLTISGNYRPKIAGADEGIWRRVVLIPWPVTIAKDKQDKYLAANLREEASGILNWMLDGLRDWLDHGLVLGDEVEAATAEYRRDSDQLGRFLEACTVSTVGDRVQSSVLHGVFNAWSKANGLNEWKGRGFSEAMTERGWKKDKSSVVYFLDLRLLKSVSDFLDHDGNPRVRAADDPGGLLGAGGLGDDTTF
jgi:putative DNA primase/helicase